MEEKIFEKALLISSIGIFPIIPKFSDYERRNLNITYNS